MPRKSSSFRPPAWPAAAAWTTRSSSTGPTSSIPAACAWQNEFASHKLVDAVGDLALAGGKLHGRFVAHRTGHELNNRLLRALFADAAAWRAVATDPLVAAA